MKKYIIYFGCLLLATCAIISCTKIEKGFLSPTIQYSPSLLVVKKGQISTSSGLSPDGSSLPLDVKWVHIYDSTGKVVDDMFRKKYKVEVWTEAYDPKTDLTFAAIAAKRSVADLEAVTVNPKSGVIEANLGSFNIPAGTYTMDIEITNQVGTQLLKEAMTLRFIDGLAVEISPNPGAFSVGRALTNTSTGFGTYNGNDNPFIKYEVKRLGDTPNEFKLKFVDRNGIPFNPKAGELRKRPNGGLNPNPPFLQNLQDYAPDTYVATDNALTIKYPLTPFPIASLGNGFNMYYYINTAAVRIDSTSAWTSNPDKKFYQGTSDPRYLGTYILGKYDYSIRVPLRVRVPGSYELTVQILNAVHR